MTSKQLAEKLNGREYLNEITQDEEKEAEANGLVVVFGYSDDNVEFVGAIDDEIGAFGGATIRLAKDGKIMSDESAANIIRAIWGQSIAWTFATDIPHERFTINEYGEPFCVGIVFSMDDLI